MKGIIAAGLLAIWFGVIVGFTAIAGLTVVRFLGTL